MKQCKITITGDLGSGKTVAVRGLSARLDYTPISLGAVQRNIAEKHGLTTLELNRLAELDPTIDEEIDSAFEKMKHSPDCLIVDSRMAWHFIPHSFKVYLTIDLATAAKRIIADKTRRTESYRDIQDAISAIKERKQSENRRFKDKYGADSSNLRLFDIVVDTTSASPELVVDLIVQNYELWRVEEDIAKFWYSPKRLYPTQSITSLTKKEDSAIDSGNQSPIGIFSVDDSLFIWDGHNRVSEAILSGLGYVPCDLIATNGEEIIPGLTAEMCSASSCPRNWLFDWEAAHGFRYESYPKA
jgi:CMP/dCMP kinase